MCGIVGIVDVRGERPIDRGLLERMNQTQVHRGPDAGGVHLAPGVGLGHRRLSIIDLAGGDQPLFNEDRSVVTVYNGEIYNFPDLMRELQELGHVFKTRCDTEVIVHAWEAWGEACVERFRGMFAFALWDAGKETLFLARDRLGIKPLYHTTLADGLFLCSSELKGIAEHPGLSKTIDPKAVEAYFGFGYVPEPRTIWKGVKKLSPGHALTWRRGDPAPRERRYWDVPFTPVSVGNEDDAAEELMARLEEAVKIRLVSEVPLGAFLSGGVDSSAVTALMGQATTTCAIGVDDPQYDESGYAAAVAERLGTDHHLDIVQPGDASLIDVLAGLYDEPFADSSAMPTYRVCEAARKRVTVALSGDGGDETLAGYRRYLWHLREERIRGFLPLGARRPLFGMLGALYPKLDWAPSFLRAKSTFQTLARDPVDGFFNSVSSLPDAWREKLFSPGLKRELQGYGAVEVFRRHAKSAPTEDPLALAQYLDLKTYLPGDILTKVDRASMAHSLEVRVPILDHELVEWTSGLPADLKLRGTTGKYLLKKGLEAHLPPAMINRPKMGFALPLTAWFRGALAEPAREALLGPAMADSGLFDMGELKRWLDRHRSGRRDYGPALWSLMMFEAFLRRSG